MKKAKGEFLLEIGCEEIPSRMLEAARQDLKKLLEGELEKSGVLNKAELEAFATPRRLICWGRGLAPAEADRVDEVIGPPRKIAYGEDGKPTRAAESFAQKQGLKVSQLKIVQTPKGDYVAAVARRKGRRTEAVLAEALPRVIQGIRFPRTMYWTTPDGPRFIRPVRWLLALWEGRRVPLSFGGVESGTHTWGHRILANRRLSVRSISDYSKKLRAAKVVVDSAARRDEIEKQTTSALKSSGFGRRADKDLLDTVVNLVECPTVVLGGFAKEFLALPAEILTTVMRHHQKYFSVEDKRGQLVPHFLAVVDLDRDRTGEIQQGHEAVLAARFRDAQFFWEADQRRTLEERLATLEQSVFVSGLGNYHQKVGRVTRLSTWLARNVVEDGRRADNEILRRAAQLSKSDLTTEMVGELPELQGVVGGLYARAQGEPEQVAQAVYDHYRPAGFEDSLPKTLEGRLLSLADKLDTVAGCLAVGLMPSGSRDPYALRRAASGIVRIIVESGLRLSLSGAVEEAIHVLQQSRVTVENPEALATAVQGFLADRVRYLFKEIRGFSYDEVNAVLAAGWDDLVDAGLRLEALRRIRPTADFEPVAAAFKRIRNILEQAGDGAQRTEREIEPELLEKGAEADLHGHFLELRTKVAELRARQRYEDALRQIASLRPTVNLFFDKVLVMSPDEAVRENRLVLLSHLLREFSSIADFSEIVVTPKTKE